MIAFRTLGALDLRKDGMEIATILAQPKRLALLAYLVAARPRGFQSRDQLMALFWPESDEERARNSLRQALHHLRRSLGEDAIPGRGDREVGADTNLIECDTVAFDQAMEAGRLEAALSIYQGDFLPGLFVLDAPDVERWMDEERSRLRRSALGAALKLSAGAERAGDLAAALEWAHRAVAIDRDDQGAIQRLEELLSRPVGGPTGTPVIATSPAPAIQRGPTDVTLTPAAAVSAGAAAKAPSSMAPIGDVGRRAMRRWPRLAAAAALLVVVGLGAWMLVRALRSTVPADGTHEPTVAVLPFVNMSGDPANEYFSDGISEELLNLLAQIPGLQVAARTSSFTFKGKNAPVDSIARVLRVRYVLEGSVRQAGARVRITAQLIDARTGFHLWSATFDRRLEDVVAVQDSIGRVIVDVLRPRLTQGLSGTRAQRREPANPEAHIAVLKGWQAFRQNTPAAWAAAAAHFETAIRHDSAYGKAWAGLATVRNWQANFRQRDPVTGYTEAEMLARRALALDSTLSEAHVVLGFVAQTRDWDFAAAEKHYANAIAANPSDTRGYSRRATMLALLDRNEEALASAKRAVELDPASPAVYSDLANTYSRMRRHADAVVALHTALALDPGHPILLGNLSTDLVQLKRFREAEDAILEIRRRYPEDVDAIGRHAYVVAQSGRRAQARALLDTAAARGVSRVSQAVTYHVLDDTARAIDLILEASREHDQDLAELLDTAQFQKIRRDPRIQRVIAQVRGSQAKQAGRPR